MVFQMRVFNVRSILAVFLAVSIISLYSMSGSAFADEGMSVTASSELGSSTIELSGITTKSGDITITVTAPNGNVVSIDQISPGIGGNFNTDFQVGSLWKQDGFYTLKINQGTMLLHHFSLEMEVVGGKILTSEASDSSLLLSSPYGQTLATDRGLEMFADAVPGSTVIGISGHTSSTQTDITITVTAPNGNVVSVDQISPGINGNFETEIATGGPLWKQDGFYTVSVQQGNSPFFIATERVEIVDGVVIPEFGTIAVLILAVAIISIVVVSARSRLSIMPKY